MTTQDYVKIAAAVKTAVVVGETAETSEFYFVGVRYTAEHVADALAADNPRFDRARFLTACGLA